MQALKPFTIRNLIFSLLLFPLLAFTQNEAIFRIDSLSKEGVLLNQGWKWHAGDNPDFARPDFDDSNWEEIDPTKDIFDLPQLSKSGEIGWFRVRINVNKSIKEQLVFTLNQSGASEIYLNGKIIHRFGVLSSDLSKVKAHTPLSKPITTNVPKDSTSVISIRYTLQPNIHYTLLLGLRNPAVQIRFYTSDTAIYNYDLINQSNLKYSIAFRIGTFAILFLVYLSLYIFYPQQKTNLFFLMYIFCSLICDFGQLIGISINHVQLFYYAKNISLDLYQIGTFLLLTALYLLMNQKRGGYYWALMALIILGVIVNASSYRFAELITVIGISNLINIEIIRITLKSIKDKKNGALIIAIGGLGFALFWGIFLLSLFFNFINTPIFGTIFTVGNLVYILALLSIPVAVCVYFGFDIAITNNALRQKMNEIETLSAEKQVLLTTQNETLERQVAERTAALKASQAQLIQSEKLASLGELTAGIAHEIQNPLNFVNNFAEVSAEMLDEMHEELEKGDTTEAIAIATDLKTNLEKINHHGQRASSIVKGMLEHSRASTGVKEPTDLNALADEYLRLAYHGLRAKDSNFNVTMETHFDPDLPKVSVIPQDIGRVLLNLINNAFYAVAERSRSTVVAPLAGAPSYQPTVAISTQKIDNQILIKIKDNGPGIPEAIKDKIFQPFFTTKPTGQGTGLGLSLAYDIVTKGHGGSIEVNSVPNAGTEFIIRLV